MRVAVVRFQIKAEAVAAFHDALVRHATTSMAREPGCLQFDFAADLTSPVHFLTYEVFTDETAFKAHLESAHMAEFRAAVKDLVVGRRVEGYQLVSRAGPSRHPKS
jgi:(4S)-4-hydroxy-5-phosphonooxypentane-2,3-dione isomerase